MIRRGRLSVRRALVSSSVLIALVFALDTAAWALTILRLRAGLSDLRSQSQAEGWRVDGSIPEAGGWPFEACLTMRDVSLEGGAKALPGGLSWQSDRVVAGLSLWHPETLFILPEGRQRLRISRIAPLVFTAASLRANIALVSGPRRRLVLFASSLTGGIEGSGHPQDVRLGTLSLDLTGEQAAHGPLTAEIALHAGGLDLPDTRRWPLGARIAGVSLAASMVSPPLGGPKGSGQGPGEQAEAWRDGGGSLTVHAMTLDWGPLAASGTAALGLDSRLQPQGRGRIKLGGYGPALEALAEGGAISSGVATTAQAVLGLMAGGSTSVDVPWSLKDSTVSVGKIPLAQLADVVWRP